MQVDQDSEHLKILSILHYVYAVLIGVTSLVGLVYVVVGGFMMVGGSGAGSSSGGAPPSHVGWIFVLLGAAFLVIGLGLSTLHVLTGLSMPNRKRWLLCVVTSSIACLNAPLGTALGVFSLVVLFKNSVKATFSNSAMTESGGVANEPPMFR